MLTLPLFVILLALAIAGIKWKKIATGSLMLGLLIGLSLAATSIGAPMLDWLTNTSETFIGAVFNLLGGRSA